MTILGIETSCDDTAAAVYDTDSGLLSQLVSSQTEHTAFGGVVPELASRAHTELILPIIRQTLHKAHVTLNDVDAVAVTRGPGLIGSLLVGTSVAQALAAARGLPMVGVHHIEGHIFANRLENPELEPPFLALVISGGHTQLVDVADWGCYRLLGNTRDDAAGEAFDKVGKMLGLGYPGGPAIERSAAQGDSGFIDFPVARVKGDPLAFSFSGLKTAVRVVVEKMGASEVAEHLEDLSASFQYALIKALVGTTMKAVESIGAQQIVLAGGVAANTALVRAFKERAHRSALTIYNPSVKFCTDNAAMIARAGSFHLTAGRTSESIHPVARLPLPASSKLDDA